MTRMMGIATLAIGSAVSAAALAQALSMQPGQWEIVSTTTSVDMPGAPPQVAAMMKGRATTIRHCITAEEVAQGPQGAMRKDKACTVDYHAGLGGRYTSVMTCRQGGGTMTATSSGTMMATSFSGTTKMATTGAQAMTLATVVTGKRLGDCKG